VLFRSVATGFAQQSTKYDGLVPQENPLRYNHTGSAPLPFVATPFVPAYTASDLATYSPVHAAGTAVEAQESTHEDEASIFWNLGIPGFSVGGVQDSNIDENPYPSSISASIRSTPIRQYAGGGTAFELASNVPVAGMTTLAAASAVGDTTVTVTNAANLIAGQPIFVDTGLNLETGVITSITGNSVTISPALKLAHPSGARFHVNQGQPIGFTGDTIERLNFFASGAPHGLGGENDPTEELLRALELPSTYTALVASGDDYLGASAKPKGTVAYFETDPVNPTSTLTVKFDASFARTHGGDTGGLKYYWD